MRGENGDLNPIFKLIVQVGVPAAIAMWLVFKMSNKLDANSEATLNLMHDHVAASAEIQKTMDRQEYNQLIMIDLLKARCLLDAKTYDQRAACYNATRR